MANVPQIPKQERKFQRIKAATPKPKPNLVSIELGEGEEAPETIEILVPGTSFLFRIYQWFYYRFAKAYSIRRMDKRDAEKVWQWYGLGSIGNAWYRNEKTKKKMTASKAEAMVKRLKNTYIGYEVEIHPAIEKL